MSSEKKIDVIKIIERVKNVLNVKTDTELAKALDIKQPTVSSWKKRDSIDFLKIIKYCNNVSLEWLIFGEDDTGEILKIDDTTKKLLIILERLDDEQKRDVLRYAQKEELLNELIRERKTG